jgi:hypothetical protein
MRELSDQIARFEMRSEQLLIYLRSGARNIVAAEKVRSELLSMLQELALLKGQRQDLAETLALRDAA